MKQHVAHEDDRWAYPYNILLIEFAATDDKEEKRKAGKYGL